MFWNSKEAQDEPLIHYESKDSRMAYRVAPGQAGRMALVVGSQLMVVENVSAGGIAFFLDEGSALAVADENEFDGTLYMGSRDNPLPITMALVDRSSKLVRCRVLHKSDILQKQLTQAIVDFQKKEIRARSLIELETEKK